MCSSQSATDGLTDRRADGQNDRPTKRLTESCACAVLKGLKQEKETCLFQNYAFRRFITEEDYVDLDQIHAIERIVQSLAMCIFPAYLTAS